MINSEAIPLVSIITPIYNSESFLSNTIESVISQTYTNWELLLIDDCSTDNSLSIINLYLQKDNRIKLLQNGINSGQAYSRNKGIKYSLGDFIALLDSDDIWYPQKLEVQMEPCLKKDVAFVYSDYELINENGASLGFNVTAPQEINFKTFLIYNAVGCLTVIYNKSKIGDLLFEEDRIYQSIEDNILWANIFKKNKDLKFEKIPQVLAQYRIRDNSSSAKKTIMLKKRIKMLNLYFGLTKFKTCWYIFNYIYINLVKKFKIKFI